MTDPFAARCRAIRDRVAAQPMARLARPPTILGQVDEARILARRAQELHRQADAIRVPMRDVCIGGITTPVPIEDSPEALERASLRALACRLEQQADEVVLVEWRRGSC